MSYVPRFDVPISIGVDVKKAGWAANAAQYGYDCNRSYMDLRGSRWRDVDLLIEVEEKLMAPCLSSAEDADNFSELWDSACDAFQLPDELYDFRDVAEYGYSLDFGTAAATLALNAAGCPTIMACSGHQTGYPYIAFWLPLTKLALIEEAAREAHVGFGNVINGAVEVFSDRPNGLLRFAIAMRARSASFGRIRANGRYREIKEETEPDIQLRLPLG